MRRQPFAELIFIILIQYVMTGYCDTKVEIIKCSNIGAKFNRSINITCSLRPMKELLGGGGGGGGGGG